MKNIVFEIYSVLFAFVGIFLLSIFAKYFGVAIAKRRLGYLALIIVLLIDIFCRYYYNNDPLQLIVNKLKSYFESKPSGIEIESNKVQQEIAVQNFFNRLQKSSFFPIPKEYTYQEGRTTPGMLPIYFDSNSYIIRRDQYSRIESNVDYLKNNPDLEIIIEGNSDPSGSNEASISIGEKRALSVKVALEKLGIKNDRLSTISYGEERLLFHGQDEEYWAKNRRVDLVVKY